MTSNLDTQVWYNEARSARNEWRKSISVFRFYWHCELQNLIGRWLIAISGIIINQKNAHPLSRRCELSVMPLICCYQLYKRSILIWNSNLRRAIDSNRPIQIKSQNDGEKKKLNKNWFHVVVRLVFALAECCFLFQSKCLNLDKNLSIFSQWLRICLTDAAFSFKLSWNDR